MVGKGGSVNWVGSQTKSNGRQLELTKNIFLYSDWLMLIRKKNTTSLSYSLTQLCLRIGKLALRDRGVKILTNVNQSNHKIHKFGLRQTFPKYPRTFLKKIKVLMIFTYVPILFNNHADKLLSIPTLQ